MEKILISPFPLRGRSALFVEFPLPEYLLYFSEIATEVLLVVAAVAAPGRTPPERLSPTQASPSKPSESPGPYSAWKPFAGREETSDRDQNPRARSGVVAAFVSRRQREFL